METYATFKLQSIVVAALFVIITLVGIQFFPSVIVILITASIASVALSWRLFRALRRQVEIQQFEVFRQSEALLGLYATLDIRHPLPHTRDRAASPDFLHLLAREIFQLRPEIIVEAGSGISTLIAAYCLKKIGGGRIVSLDHIEKYAELTRQMIASHGLEDYVDLLYAPIKTHRLDGKDYPWYDDSELESVARIDMLIVDGPPRNLAKDARYPAIPLLFDKLHEHSVVILDDGNRSGEREIISRWETKYGLTCTPEKTEDGAFSCRPGGKENR